MEVDQRLGTKEMYDLTLAYEQLVYRNQHISEDRKQLQDSFQHIIDRIFA
ncbi:hypothetical protein [Gracilibacillus boraciitolerans]|nr:hypothetical protein [Gracilibacillus boraciitolerans]